MDTRDKLIEATRELLWERGYGATSPRAILAASGAGQGSMYHHFSGKEELALAAVERNSADMRAQVTRDIAAGTTAVGKIESYLRRERPVLKGCQFGKLTQDPDVIESDALRAEVDETLAWARGQIATVIAEGKASGEFPDTLDPVRIADTVVATLQGGYVLARAAQDVTVFDSAITGVIDLLRTVATERPATWNKDAGDCVTGD